MGSVTLNVKIMHMCEALSFLYHMRGIHWLNQPTCPSQTTLFPAYMTPIHMFPSVHGWECWLILQIFVP